MHTARMISEGKKDFFVDKNKFINKNSFHHKKILRCFMVFFSKYIFYYRFVFCLDLLLRAPFYCYGAVVLSPAKRVTARYCLI